MEVIKLTENNISSVAKYAAKALKKGQVVVYPTDTSYGLGALISNKKAIERIYKIKQRNFNNPVHILVPSLREAKKLLIWNVTAEKLSKKFLPGPLSIALPLNAKSSKDAMLKKLSANTGYLGFRLPKTSFALKLVKFSGGPLTATSANPSSKVGGVDAYSAESVIKQFKNRRHKPDLIIDAGLLRKIKPSTFIKVDEFGLDILRVGPISAEHIVKALNSRV